MMDVETEELRAIRHIFTSIKNMCMPHFIDIDAGNKASVGLRAKQEKKAL